MFTIYSKTYCPYCSSAKSFLQEQWKEYTEINLDEDPDKMREVVQISGMMTVPQIFKGEVKKENFIGGYSEMMDLYTKGKLF